MFLANNLNKGGGAAGGYQISRSLRFNSADSAYLNRTPASAGNLKTWTWSGWVKRSKLGVQQTVIGYVSSGGSWQHQIEFTSSDTLNFYIYDGGVTTQTLTTTQVFRDVSAWYHLVVVQDTTQATSSNRAKIYVNGVQVTSFGIASYPSQNYDGLLNSAVNTGIGAGIPYGLNYYSGYQTEIYFIDGQALTPSSFGETNADTGVWQPKAYSGSYGTNGFYLNFSDNSNTTAATLGKDYSGNGNNWTPNNFSVTAGAGNDSLVDSPTSYGTDTGVGGTVRGNYCTWNPLDIQNSVLSLTNGNLDFSGGTTGFIGSRGTIGMTSGKWYWEITAGGSGNVFGIMTSAATTVGIDFYPGRDAYGWGYYGGNGNKFNNNSGTAYGATFTNGDVIGIAFDADAGTLVFYKNGTSQGTAFSSLTSGPYFPAFGESATTGSTNFGQRPFAYTAPSGYKALCTQNLPTPTIGATTATQAGKYFNPVLYTGTGANLSVTGVGFQPDLTWVKCRSTAYSHGVNDAVRGAGATLVTNDTAAEYAYSAYFTGFTSDGFNLGSGSSVFNFASNTYVAWNWKANGSGSTNTAGTITSTVSANTTSGFSVVTYTGNGSFGSVGHGLGVAPAMVIIKTRNNVYDWLVYHQSLGTTKTLFLNLTSAAVTATEINNTSSTTMTVQSEACTASNNYVAYCFAEVAGYSKFGSYTGNGSSDGPFVYTGFRPRFIMVKRTDSTANWYMYDTARSPSNVTGTVLFADASFSEADIGPTNYLIDIDSNGFKLRNNYAYVNESGGTYIFMAIAETPFKFALAR